MPLFHVFKEFSAKYNRVKLKYFDIQTSYRFAARFAQLVLPIGIWILLLTQARDVQTQARVGNLAEFFNTCWAMSVILGPLAAVLLFGLHRVPFFADPLNSLQILYIEAVCDFLVMGGWTGLAAGTPFKLTSEATGCPPEDIMIVPTSVGNDTNLGINNEQQNTTMLGNQTVSVTRSATITPECIPHPTLWLSLTAIFGTLACLFFLSLSMDIFSYMKGVYWDIQEHNEREHAATASTLRQLNKFGATRMSKDEFAGVAVKSGSCMVFASTGSLKKSNSVQGGLGALKGTVRVLNLPHFKFTFFN